MRWRRAASAGKGSANAEDTANHLVGGILMGFGGVTALGCTIGQGISALSTLALGGFVSFAAIVGARVGLAYQEWRVMLATDPRVLRFRLAASDGSLAQLVEQRTFNPLVAGSNPARPTIHRSETGQLTGLAFFVSAPAGQGGF